MLALVCERLAELSRLREALEVLIERCDIRGALGCPIIESLRGPRGEMPWTGM
jgi:hypothetical protein